MQIIDYKLIDELRKYIENSEKNMRYYAENRMYDCANTCEQNMSLLQNMLNTILARFVTEIPDEADTDDKFIYLNKNNWMQYWDKEIQVSDTEDFSTFTSTGWFVGYTPSELYPYHISDGNSYKYARVKRTIKEGGK